MVGGLSLKPKIVQLASARVAQAFEREAELIKQVQGGALEQCLLLWRPAGQTLVLPASRSWQALPELVSQLESSGWDMLSRRTGGAPVPQHAGVINVSHIYVWKGQEEYSTRLGYEDLCRPLAMFFESFGVPVAAHATPFSYCDGDYNLNVAGQKVVGTAQRVMLKSGGEKIVLAQACIVVDADLDELIAPVNVCNELNGKTERVRAEAHTCLSRHVADLPATPVLFQRLIQSFGACQRSL